MKKYLLIFLLLSTYSESSEPIKKSYRDICYEPDHPIYNKIKDFKAYKTVEDCMRSGGKKVDKTV
jgi:hypothetical protein